jgi:hypothetical protein
MLIEDLIQLYINLIFYLYDDYILNLIMKVLMLLTLMVVNMQILIYQRLKQVFHSCKAESLHLLKFDNASE